MRYRVVLYRFSTSNHNFYFFGVFTLIVVLYRFSTSNHNLRGVYEFFFVLYYIVSLHQTTTQPSVFCFFPRCIISFLYIKPQLIYVHYVRFSVVLYRFSTSNHNWSKVKEMFGALYYIVSLHQTTTAAALFRSTLSCIISFLYIKPQPLFNISSKHSSCIISFLYIKPQLPFVI